MPNIQSATQHDGGFTIVASDSSRVTVLPADVQAYANNLGFNDINLTQTTVQRWVAQTISDGVGVANVAPDQIQVALELDSGGNPTGVITDLTFLG